MLLHQIVSILLGLVQDEVVLWEEDGQCTFQFDQDSFLVQKSTSSFLAVMGFVLSFYDEGSLFHLDIGVVLNWIFLALLMGTNRLELYLRDVDVGEPPESNESHGLFTDVLDQFYVVDHEGSLVVLQHGRYLRDL